MLLKGDMESKKQGLELLRTVFPTWKETLTLVLDTDVFSYRDSVALQDLFSKDGDERFSISEKDVGTVLDLRERTDLRELRLDCCASLRKSM